MNISKVQSQDEHSNFGKKISPGVLQASLWDEEYLI